MIKKITLIVLLLIFGLIISLSIDSYLRKQIFNLYKWSTSNKIVFTGKDFHFFPSTLFLVSFSISFTLTLFNLKYSDFKFLKKITLWIVIFIISIILISAINANLLIIQCAACENGIVKISYYKVNYGLILGISSFFSAIPSIITLIKALINPKNSF